MASKDYHRMTLHGIQRLPSHDAFRGFLLSFIIGNQWKWGKRLNLKNIRANGRTNVRTNERRFLLQYQREKIVTRSSFSTLYIIRILHQAAFYARMINLWKLSAPKFWNKNGVLSSFSHVSCERWGGNQCITFISSVINNMTTFRTRIIS